MFFDDHGHILCAAVADFDGISIKYFVELARSREVLVNLFQEGFPNVCLDVFVKGWVEPNYVPFSISLFWPVGVKFKICCVSRSFERVFIFFLFCLLKYYDSND